MNPLKRFTAAVFAATALGANAGEYTDLWNNPQEAGWGVNVVQQLETAFVTLFVYGPDGKPTWYVAPDATIEAYSSPGGFPLFTGTLYRTRGPWHGGPFDPDAVEVAAVGAMSLEVLAKDRMRVHYSAEGIARVKEVGRFSFQAPLTGANYASQFILRVSYPGQPPLGTARFQAEMQLHLGLDNQAFVRTDDHLGRRCEYRGPWQQQGKLMKVTGSYTCTAGESLAGGFEMTDLEVTANGLSGRLRMVSPQIVQNGRFAAVLE